MKKILTGLFALVMACAPGLSTAQDRPISALPAASALDGTELVLGVQTAVTKKLTVDQISTRTISSDAELACVAAITSGADLMNYWTGSGTCATTSALTYGRSLLGTSSAATAATLLGLGTGNTPVFTGLQTTGGAGTDSIFLNNATSNFIRFRAAGLGAPAFTTRSAGTKVILYDAISGSAADYGIGVETGATWFSVGDTAKSYKWYGGTTLAATLSGTGLFTPVLPIAATSGGTGQTSYAVGDLLYAPTTTTIGKLADIATGNALISGGVGAAPSYGKIGLTTHVSGILPVANGGTNNAFFTVAGPATSAKTYTLPNASSTILTDNAAVTIAQGGTGATSAANAATALGLGTGNTPTLAGVSLTSTTDISLSSTGHAFQVGLTSGQNIVADNNEIMARNNGATSNLSLQFDGGSLTVGGPTTINSTLAISTPLTVANGGTGAATLTGYVKGAGTSILTATATVPASDLTDLHPGYVSGLFYGQARTTATNSNAAADVLYAIPIFIGKPVTVQALAVYVATGVAATNAKLGIYTNSNGRPGTLLVQTTAPVATATSTTSVSAALTANTLLATGWYWLASLYDGAPSVASTDPGGQIGSSVIGAADASSALRTVLQSTGVSGVATYAGGLPGTFGAATVRTVATPNVAFQVQ